MCDPEPAPFLSFYTPTYRRPHGLAACLDSVRRQTLVHRVEQLVVPDHVGVGVAGMFANVPRYAHALHGRYVHMLCDDDVLASPTVVQEVAVAIQRHDNPDVLVVSALKGGNRWPTCTGRPVLGQIDLSCLIVEGRLWRELAGAGAYGHRYEGDYDFAAAAWERGARFVYVPELLFVIGGVSRGAAEGAWP